MYTNLLAQKVAQILNPNLLGEYTVLPVTNPEMFGQVQRLLKLDYRAKKVREPGYGSVFEGIAFESEVTRSQAIALQYNGEIVATMCFVIASCGWISSQRYFERVKGNVMVRNFESFAGETPSYVIIPAWTVVSPKHSSKLAVVGFRSFLQVISLLKDNAPTNTYIETIAMGLGSKRKAFYGDLATRAVGTIISPEEFATPLEQIGVPYEGSRPIVKMAKLLGLSKVEGFGSSRTLGPVFKTKVN